MSEPFIGEIKMFAGNFAIRGWALCDGQLLSISQNTALFSLLGTTYGGDGRTTFGLPDMRGRLPIHAGSGPGLSTRQLGSRTGDENVTLHNSQIPSHSHPFQSSTSPGTGNAADGMHLSSNNSIRMFRPTTPNAQLASTAVSNSGGSQSHANMMPFLCVNFIIALVGLFPSRN